MKRAGEPVQLQVSAPPEPATRVGARMTTAFCVVLSPLMVIMPVSGLTEPPVTLPIAETDSCTICGDASEIWPVPTDCTASDIDVLNPEPAMISSDTVSYTHLTLPTS